MRVRALAIRILNQLRRDRRTLALMMMAPLLILSLMYFVLRETNVEPRLGVVNAPLSYIQSLERNGAIIVRCASDSEAMALVDAQDIVAIVNMAGGKTYVKVDGGNPGKAARALAIIEAAKMAGLTARADLKTDVTYIYGYSDMSTFDQFGSVLIGFITFFFVFLISGISFLRERTTGTLEKLLSTPIRRWEIVLGYIIGFGVVTVLQSLVICWFSIQILGTMMVGSWLLIICITFFTALSALSLGILLSTLANNEFQMVQFIPIIVIPQLVYSGLFDLTNLAEWVQAIGYVMPLSYAADALLNVMIRGNGFEAIIWDIAALFGFTSLFMIVNTLALKKHRRL